MEKLKDLPSIQLLDQRIDRITLEELLTDIKKTIRYKQKSLYFAVNIHNFLLLKENAQEKRQYESSRAIYADGVPLVWFSHVFGRALPGRVSGTDLVERLLEDSTYSLYIVGGTPQIIQKIQKKYNTVSGYFCPPFGEAWNESINKEIVRDIKMKNPQVILVAVGALKQERWLWEYFDKTPAFVGLGVGSALEILAGEKPRAPRWMQGIGLEWLWRIFLEPQRLWKRYVIDSILFLKYLTHYFFTSMKGD